MITGTARLQQQTWVNVPAGETLVISTLNGSYGIADLYDGAAGSPMLSTMQVPAGVVMAIGPYVTLRRVAMTPQQGSGFSYIEGLYLRPTRGPSSARPIAAADQVALFFDETLGKELYWSAPHWFDMTNTQVADVAPTGLPKEFA